MRYTHPSPHPPSSPNPNPFPPPPPPPPIQTPLPTRTHETPNHLQRYLVDRGAAVNDNTPEGNSVLDMAKRYSGPDLQRYLAAKVTKQAYSSRHGISYDS